MWMSRVTSWDRMSRDLDAGRLDLVATEIGLHEVITTAAEQLAGRVRGRIVVDVSR